MANRPYPLARRGPIIGTPHAGSHTRGNWQSDNAIDIAVPVGTPVYAVADGVIGSRIGLQNSSDPKLAGNRLTVQAAGNAYFYAHLSKLAVTAGEHVTAGQLLGYSGSANGAAHLHFAVQKGSPADATRGAAPPAAPSVGGAGSPQAGVPGDPTPPPDITAPAIGTPPAAANPSVELPGTAQHYLPGQGAVADSWQSIAALPDLSPDTQRLIALSSGG